MAEKDALIRDLQDQLNQSKSMVQSDEHAESLVRQMFYAGALYLDNDGTVRINKE